MVITFNTGLGSTLGVFPATLQQVSLSLALFLITRQMQNNSTRTQKKVSLQIWDWFFFFWIHRAPISTQSSYLWKEITYYSLYGSSAKAGMICKWILPDSSVYYAVTLVSSDAVWLLSHLTSKKGSWVRGMDCAPSALVTQIVQTLQRNKCIFDCGCMEGMWKIHFL